MPPHLHEWSPCFTADIANILRKFATNKKSVSVSEAKQKSQHPPIRLLAPTWYMNAIYHARRGVFSFRSPSWGVFSFSFSDTTPDGIIVQVPYGLHNYASVVLTFPSIDAPEHHYLFDRHTETVQNSRSLKGQYINEMTEMTKMLKWVRKMVKLTRITFSKSLWIRKRAFTEWPKWSTWLKWR